MKNGWKRLLRLLCVAVMILACVPVFGATLEYIPQVTFYQNGQSVAAGEIQAGELTAKVRAFNEDANSGQSATAILAAYDQGGKRLADLSYEQKEMYPAPFDKTFDVGPVTVPQGGTARVYVWKGSELVPASEGTGVVNQSLSLLSAAKVGDYPTAVDNAAKKILVNTTADISSAAVTGVVVPAGASYTVAQDNVSLTMTTADGRQITYAIEKQDFIKFDFETEDQWGGTTAASSPTYWFNKSDADANVAVGVEADPLDTSNKVIKIRDDDGAKSAIARLTIGNDSNNLGKSFPWVVSYRIMYDEPNAGDDTSYSAMALNSSLGTTPELLRAGNFKRASGQDRFENSLVGHTFNVSKKGGPTTTYQETYSYFDLKTWHEVEIVALDVNTVNYYLDGKLVYQGASAKDEPLGSLRFTTNPNRTCTVYLDDVVVRDYIAQNQLIGASFTKREENLKTFTYDGVIYVNTDSLDEVSLTECVVSAGASYSFDASKGITITSANGEQAEYLVKAKRFFTDNFESYGEGKTPDQSNSTYYTGNSPQTDKNKTTIQVENGNQYVRLYDDDITAAYVTISPGIQPKSFVLDFDVRYDILPGRSFTNSPDSPFYSLIRVNNTAEHAFLLFEPYSGTQAALNLHYQIGGEVVSSNADASFVNVSSKTAACGKWYHVQIVYRQAEDGGSATATYTFDDTVVGTSSTVGVFDLNTVRMTTSPGRYSTVDYDNITILPLD